MVETRKQEENKETTDEQMDEQKGDIKRLRMHVKRDHLKRVFFLQKGNCCSKKLKKVKVKKMSSRRKRSRKFKIKRKKDERNLMDEKHQKNIRKRLSTKKDQKKGDKTKWKIYRETE